MSTSFDLHVESPPHPPSPPNYRFKPAQEKYAEARVTFDKTLKGHYRHSKSGYDKVGALFLTWESDDMQCKSTEVDALNHFFASKMRFETDHYEIPSEKWQTSLNRKLSDFVFKYDSPDCLILVYYGGHAYFGEETGAFKLSGKAGADGDGDPNYFWNDINHVLRLPACDQLVIADCCFAASAFTPEHIGKRKFELMASAAPNKRVPSPKWGKSFTAALTEVLETLLHDFPSGFSTSQLYRQVYHKWDYKKTRPFLFDQSRRNHDKIWLRPQEDPEVSRDQPHGLGETRLNLTLRLNKEPGAVIMNQLALALQYLPHVDEIRYEKLYAPKDQIEDFMLRIVQAQRLRPLMRNLHAKRRLQKLKALAPEENGLQRHLNFFNLFLEQNPESAYDWSSAKFNGCTYNALLQKDRRKSTTWPATGRMKMKSLSNRFFSLDWKYNIPDNQGFLTRILPRRIHTIDFANISLINKSSSSTAPSVDRPRLENENMPSFMTKDFTRERYLCSEEVWHIFMWLAMIYVQYSLFCSWEIDLKERRIHEV